MALATRIRCRVARMIVATRCTRPLCAGVCVVACGRTRAARVMTLPGAAPVLRAPGSSDCRVGHAPPLVRGVAARDGVLNAHATMMTEREIGCSAPGPEPGGTMRPAPSLASCPSVLLPLDTNPPAPHRCDT